MVYLDENLIERYAKAEGYTKCQHDEVVMAFTRPCEGGDRELVRVWYTTGTVGTYLKHPPTQRKTQLFRRGIDSIDALHSIFINPRVHTGLGYKRVKRPAPTVPCLACGKLYQSASGSVQHFESGRCPSCPGADAAKRMAYNVAQSSGATFVVQRLGYYEDDHGSGYRSGEDNYECRACGKRTKTLNSLMQHMESRPQCKSHGGIPALQLTYP